MYIRAINENDAESFYNMMCRLDEETEFMLYEPGERERTSKNLDSLKTSVERAVSGADLLLVALNDEDEIVGYIWAERGKLNRVSHTAYIVVGILTAYRRQGIGTEFFRRLDEWARANGVQRLELTVECANIAALRLYEKHGFKVEGLRAKSMKVDGKLIDEYYMGKIVC